MSLEVSKYKNKMKFIQYSLYASNAIVIYNTIVNANRLSNVCCRVVDRDERSFALAVSSFIMNLLGKPQPFCNNYCCRDYDVMYDLGTCLQA